MSGSNLTLEQEATMMDEQGTEGINGDFTVTNTTSVNVGDVNGSVSIMDNGTKIDNTVDEPTDTEGTTDEGNPSGDNTEGDPPEETKKEGNEPTIQDQIDNHDKTLSALKTDLKNKGVDFNQAIKEYNEAGALSQQTVADLIKAGYPKEVIESFIESRVALEERFTKAVYEVVGGQKEYESLIQWAKSNLPEKVLQSYNRAIDNNNFEAISLMLEGIRAKRVAKMGTRNPSIMGNTASKASGAPKGFTSVDEVRKAMSDPRYGRDASYTRSVEEKMYYTNGII